MYIHKWTCDISSVSKSKSCKFSSAVSGAASALWKKLGRASLIDLDGCVRRRRPSACVENGTSKCISIDLLSSCSYHTHKLSGFNLGLTPT